MSENCPECARLTKERDAALAALDQERSEEPGTIRGRMNGLAKWAEETLGHDPYSSRGFEGTIIASAKSAAEEVARLRKAVAHLAMLTTKDEAWAYLTSAEFSALAEGRK